MHTDKTTPAPHRLAQRGQGPPLVSRLGRGKGKGISIRTAPPLFLIPVPQENDKFSRAGRWRFLVRGLEGDRRNRRTRGDKRTASDACDNKKSGRRKREKKRSTVFRPCRACTLTCSLTSRRNATNLCKAASLAAGYKVVLTETAAFLHPHHPKLPPPREPNRWSRVTLGRT